MSTVITITVSGSSASAKSTIVHTIRQALKDASLDVQEDSEQPPIAMTTLYEQQTRLAMAGVQCVVKAEAEVMKNSFASA